MNIEKDSIIASLQKSIHKNNIFQSSKVSSQHITQTATLNLGWFFSFYPPEQMKKEISIVCNILHYHQPLKCILISSSWCIMLQIPTFLSFSNPQSAKMHFKNWFNIEIDAPCKHFWFLHVLEKIFMCAFKWIMDGFDEILAKKIPPKLIKMIFVNDYSALSGLMIK